MRLALFLRSEDAGTFQHDVDMLPWQFGRVANCRDRNGAAAHVDHGFAALDFDGKPPVHRIIPEQVRIGFDRPKIVDRHDFDVGSPAFNDGTQDVASNSAKPVDCHTYSQVILLS